jgi:hypothetical protein
MADRSNQPPATFVGAPVGAPSSRVSATARSRSNAGTAIQVGSADRLGLPTRFELVVNDRTAKAPRIAVPRRLLSRADEIID